MNSRVFKLTIDFVRRHWRLVIEFVTFVGLLFAVLEIMLSRQEVELARQSLELAQEQLVLQATKLEYSYQIVLPPADQKAISEVIQQLVEDFFVQVQSLRSRDGVTYLEAMDSVLPLTSTVSTEPASTVVSIRNAGSATSRNVRLFLETDWPITGYQIESLEPSSILKGGIGQNQITIEMDRIVAGDKVTIILESEAIEGQSQLDLVVLEKTEESPFPRPRHIPAMQPDVSVKITSDEGPATYSGPINVGDTVVAASSLYVRGTPGYINESVTVAFLMAGDVAEVTDGPRYADGLIWWLVTSDSGWQGWVAQYSATGVTFLRRQE